MEIPSLSTNTVNLGLRFYKKYYSYLTVVLNIKKKKKKFASDSLIKVQDSLFCLIFAPWIHKFNQRRRNY